MAPAVVNGSVTIEAESKIPNQQCYDQEPIRLVNPLAELGPPFTVSLPASASVSDLELIDPELTSIIDDKKNVGRQKNSRSGKNNSGTCTKNTRTTLLTAINDWLPLQDLWLGPPNTYPISYWARLLGLSIVNNDNVDIADINENVTDIFDQSVCLTKDQILAASKLRDRRFDPVYQTPQSGTFASDIWKGLRDEELIKKLRVHMTKSAIDDERILGTCKDPLYQRLLFLNNCNNEFFYSLMGLGTPENSNPKELHHKVSRSFGYRRSTSFLVEGANMIIVPVTPQEHFRFQVPMKGLVEIIDEVWSTASYNMGLSSIKWNQNRRWDECNLEDDDFDSPLPKFYNPKTSNKISQMHDSQNDIDNAPYYSFHTLSQARLRFPELTEELENVALKSGYDDQAVPPGVTDGWVAIIQHQLKDNLFDDPKQHPRQEMSMATEKGMDQIVTVPFSIESNLSSIENQQYANNEQKEATCDRLAITEDQNDFTSTSPAIDSPRNSMSYQYESQTFVKEGLVASVGGFLTYQFMWLRDKKQNVEDSDLVARILSIETIYDDATRKKSKLGSNLKKPEIIRNEVRLILISLAITVFKSVGVPYSFFRVRSDEDRYFLETFFRMIGPVENRGDTMMICDISMINHRYAVLYYNEKSQLTKSPSLQLESGQTGSDQRSSLDHSKRRWLFSLPKLEAAKKLETDSLAYSTIPNTTLDTQQRVKATRTSNADEGLQVFSNASSELRNTTVWLRAKLTQLNGNGNIGENQLETQNLSFNNINNNAEDDSIFSSTAMELIRVNLDGSDGDSIVTPAADFDIPSLNLIRSFAVSRPAQQANSEDCPHDGISEEIIRLQDSLNTMEQELEPKLKSLLASVIDDRIKYENEEADLLRYEEMYYLSENKKMLERRKELDQAWQKQLEQDMDAVCEICNDGEVTVDNQILFCESCNVAVHQMCYGIERVPDGDYYCLPCKRLGRDKHSLSQGGVKPAPKPLPICCELCPLKQGAFVRTDVNQKDSSNAVDKWVHSVCAKWQGLSFVDLKKPDLVEDVTETKISFRRLGIKCDICQGEYGAMTKCLHGEEDGSNEGCNKWFHVTCARAVGTLRVMHGENCKGPVGQNPWRLICPEHSNLSPEEIPQNSIPAKTLMLAAKEFPPEPRPPPEPVQPKPFNTATRKEREYLLAIPEYENQLMVELLTKKFHGARCEICDHVEDDSKLLTRCSGCLLTFCNACKILPDENNKSQFFYCPSCVYIAEKKKAKVEAFDEPRCVVCVQKGSFLRKAFAKPVLRKSFWKNNKAVKNTYFGRQLWVHSVCAFWHPKLTLPYETGLVDLSNFVLSNGKGLVENRIPCYLCGQSGGMKIHCDQEGCRMTEAHLTSFHVTCARQAGLEVAHREGKGDEIEFYAHCYRHGGNSFNLRAKLEDMVEHEKKRAATARAGKDFAKLQAPMTFSQGSKILNAGVQVMRILGWAWRWAEFWVDYDSSWEPLLEPGQIEELMTKKELKIVDSTRKSRCSDARRCRLAAFGAALRNRNYDTEDGFDNDSLHRALRAILSTPSLVGPLEGYEIDFFVEWLGRSYRSKSRLLFMGDDKVRISKDSPFCVHEVDKSPKFELSDRPIPGKQELSQGNSFESDILEPDNFMFASPETHTVTQIRPQKRKKKKDNILKADPDDTDNNTFTPQPSEDIPIQPVDPMVFSSRRRDRTSKESESETRDQGLSENQDRFNTAGATLNRRRFSMDIPASKKRIKNSSETPSEHLLIKLSGSAKRKRSYEAQEDAISPSRVPKQKKRQKESSLKNMKTSSPRLSPKNASLEGFGNTPLTLYDIDKWHASSEARAIFIELSKSTQYIQQLLAKARKRGVFIEQYNPHKSKASKLYSSMGTAANKSGISRYIITPMIRGELESTTEWRWRYVYDPACDEQLSNVKQLSNIEPLKQVGDDKSSRRLVNEKSSRRVVNTKSEGIEKNRKDEETTKAETLSALDIEDNACKLEIKSRQRKPKQSPILLQHAKTGEYTVDDSQGTCDGDGIGRSISSAEKRSPSSPQVGARPALIEPVSLQLDNDMLQTKTKGECFDDSQSFGKGDNILSVASSPTKPPPNSLSSPLDVTRTTTTEPEQCAETVSIDLDSDVFQSELALLPKLIDKNLPSVQDVKKEGDRSVDDSQTIDERYDIARSTSSVERRGQGSISSSQYISRTTKIESEVPPEALSLEMDNAPFQGELEPLLKLVDTMTEGKCVVDDSQSIDKVDITARSFSSAEKRAPCSLTVSQDDAGEKQLEPARTLENVSLVLKTGAFQGEMVSQPLEKLELNISSNKSLEASSSTVKSDRDVVPPDEISEMSGYQIEGNIGAINFSGNKSKKRIGRPKRESRQIKKESRSDLTQAKNVVIEDVLPSITGNNSRDKKAIELEQESASVRRRKMILVNPFQKCGRKPFDLNRKLNHTKGGRVYLDQWNVLRQFAPSLYYLSSSDVGPDDGLPTRFTEVRSSGRHYFPVPLASNDIGGVNTLDANADDSALTTPLAAERRSNSSARRMSSRNQNVSSEKKKRGRPPRSKEDTISETKNLPPSAKKRKVW